MKILIIIIALILASLSLGYYKLSRSDVSGMIESTQKTVAIFDFDGVICDSHPQMVEAFNEIAPYYNVTKLTPESLAFYHNNLSKEYYGVSSWKLPIFVIHLRQKLKARMSIMPLQPGIKQLINDLKDKGLIIGILTSNSQTLVHGFLKRNDLDKFDFIYTGSGVYDKAEHLKVIKDKLKSNKIFYIGDEVRDVNAANVSNIKAIGVTWGFQSKGLLESAKPYAIAETPKDLLNILVPKD